MSITSPESIFRHVLQLDDIEFLAQAGPGAQPILQAISFRIPAGSCGAIIGPSGSGKSSLLKVIAGIHEHSKGVLRWEERDLTQHDLAPGDIGYVPQFTIAFEFLTVGESLAATLQLRLPGMTGEGIEERSRQLLEQVGLGEQAGRQVRYLSGGERRRLSLAMELVSSPSLLLCDEVTSGLDPKSEEEIVTILRSLAREEGRIVLSVTHSPSHLARYDPILVMHEGHLAFCGSFDEMLAYFEVEHPEEVFARLGDRDGAGWHERRLEEQPPEPEPAPEPDPSLVASEPHLQAELPGAWTQFRVVFGRRLRIFFRDTGHAWLHLALMLGFPFLVVIFAYEGLPQVQNLSMDLDTDLVRQLGESLALLEHYSHAGTLVSGIVMFQVVLLALMASNNGAREIAAERDILEKEKLAGLRPSSYLASKVCFALLLAAAQSVWMALFVDVVCAMPGNIMVQALVLFLLNAAVSMSCLAIFLLHALAGEGLPGGHLPGGLSAPALRGPARPARDPRVVHPSLHLRLLGLGRGAADPQGYPSL